ncbi:MAG: AsmA family protein [Lentisphaerae bacterium]|nr:AsmA family protein [Lentisphaerota bacterium]
MVSYPQKEQRRMEMAEKRKSGFVRRLVKFIVYSAIGLLAFALLLAATLPLWISPVATAVAGRVVPGYTGTDFRIDGFYVNPYSGAVRINGVKLSNPQGFGEAAAFSLSSFSVDLAVGSLFSDTVLVKEIVIEDPFVSYYSHDGSNNFDVILANVENAKGAKDEDRPPRTEEPESDAPGKKVVIERLRINGTKVKLMKSNLMPPFMVPPLELTDIGKKSGGATLEEAWAQIANGVMKSMSDAGDGIGALGGILGSGAKDASGKFSAGMEELTSIVGGFGDAIKPAKSDRKVSESGKSGGNVVSKTSDAAVKTIGAIGDTAKNAIDVVGDTTKGTVDAVNDTAKKATEGVKKLFKGFGKQQ